MCRVVSVLGYVPQDLVGEVSYQYYHPDDLHRMVQLHQNGQCLTLHCLLPCVHMYVCGCMACMCTIHDYSSTVLYMCNVYSLTDCYCILL